jgi:integrase
MTYLLRHSKSGVYYFRRAVPDDLRETIGKTAIKESLGTKDVREAKRRAHSVAARVDADFAKARAILGAPVQSHLSDAEIERLSAIHLHHLLADDEETRIHGDSSDELYLQLKRQVEAAGGFASFSDQEATATVGMSARAYQKKSETLAIVGPALKAALARGDTTIVAEDVDEMLAANGIKLGSTSDAFRKLCFACLKASVKAFDAMIQRHNGEVVETPPAPPAPIVRGVTVPSKDGVDLLTMFEKWLEERKPARTTVLNYTTAIRRFTELHGNLAVHEITKPHVRSYKSALLRIPRSLSGDRREVSLPQLLERLEEDPTPNATTLTAGSVNKAIGALQAVLGWVGKQGYLDDYPNWSNPADDMKMHDPADDEENRLPYDEKDLTLIFNSPVFRGGERPRAGGGEAAKWIPLLSLFSGARLEEMGQALVSDVKERDGIAYLDINTLDRQARKRLKNRSSRRKLPLHPELLRCGLLAYVEERRRNNDIRLFPDLRPSVSGQVTGNWSKWWGRYTDSLGITDPRKVFHSFRHTFKRACRAARIEEELHDALTGHTSANVGRSYGSGGGDGVPLEVLHDAISKVNYKGLDLAHLYAPL